MPIRVKCRCGKVLAAKDEMAGKAIRCPACKTPIKVPAGGGAPAAKGRPAPAGKKPAPAKKSGEAQEAPGSSGGLDELFDQEGIRAIEGTPCPSCGHPMKPGAVLCTQCGYNTQTGERLVGYGQVSSDGVRNEFGNRDLDAAAMSLRREAAIQKTLQGTGMAWWMLALVILMLVSMAVVGVFVSVTFGAEEIDPNSVAGRFKAFGAGRAIGTIIYAFSGLILLIFWIQIVVAAFKDTKTQGLLCLLIPPYTLVYTILRWSRLGGIFSQMLIWLCVLALGLYIAFG